MSSLLQELNPPERVLLGPGPSNCSPRVLQALSKPMIGHLDPEFLIMEQTRGNVVRCFKLKSDDRPYGNWQFRHGNLLC